MSIVTTSTTSKLYIYIYIFFLILSFLLAPGEFFFQHPSAQQPKKTSLLRCAELLTKKIARPSDALGFRDVAAVMELLRAREGAYVMIRGG